jgi:hypothetical protein
MGRDFPNRGSQTLLRRVRLDFVAKTRRDRARRRTPLTSRPDPERLEPNRRPASTCPTRAARARARPARARSPRVPSTSRTSPSSTTTRWAPASPSPASPTPPPTAPSRPTWYVTQSAKCENPLLIHFDAFRFSPIDLRHALTIAFPARATFTGGGALLSGHARLQRRKLGPALA